MNSKLLIAVLSCGVSAAVALPAVPIKADDTGLAGAIHTLRREGKKICQEGHFHSGTSAGASSKSAAMNDAIGSWQSFTAMEYGSDWARFRKAASKSAKCSTSSGSWSCEVQARPCK